MTAELKGWHVLALLLAFFGITIAVNVMLSVYAIDTFSGEDVSKPYVAGLNYNRTLEARAAQNELGWTATVGAKLDRGTATVSVHIAGRDGVPKNKLVVDAVLRRPTDANLDQKVTLASTGNGVYEAAVAGIVPGAWDVVVHAQEDGAAFEAERRVVLE